MEKKTDRRMGMGDEGTTNRNLSEPLRVAIAVCVAEKRMSDYLISSFQINPWAHMVREKLQSVLIVHSVVVLCPPNNGKWEIFSQVCAGSSWLGRFGSEEKSANKKFRIFLNFLNDSQGNSWIISSGNGTTIVIVFKSLSEASVTILIIRCQRSQYNPN